MNGSWWSRFLEQWLRRHPVKRFPASGPEGEQFRWRVMQRVKTEQAPQPVWRPARVWLPRPRVSMALATVGVCALALIVLARRLPLPTPTPPSRTEQLAQEIHHQLIQLAQADAGDALEALWSQQMDENLEENVAMLDELLMLAETVPPPAESVDIPALYRLLLEEAGEDALSIDEGASDDELLLELEWLDLLSPDDVASS